MAEWREVGWRFGDIQRQRGADWFGRGTDTRRPEHSHTRLTHARPPWSTSHIRLARHTAAQLHCCIGHSRQRKCAYG